MRRRTTGTIALLAALLSGACDSKSADERTCHQSGGAELCLVEADSAFKLEGTGFEPRSEVLVGIDDDGRAMVLTADDGGSVPEENASAGVLPGPTVQHVTITGRSVSGADVRVEFEIPAVSR